MTEWPEFAELDLAAVASAMRGNLLVDGRNLFDPERVRDAGLVYEGIGRAADARPTPSRPELACRRSSSPAARARGCGR